MVELPFIPEEHGDEDDFYVLYIAYKAETIALQRKVKLFYSKFSEVNKENRYLHDKVKELEMTLVAYGHIGEE